MAYRNVAMREGIQGIRIGINISFHAHELPFSCYHRYDYLNDTAVCVLLEDWPWSSAWARQTGVGPILDMFCVPFLTK